MTDEVTDNPAESRFEMRIGEALAFVDYRRSGSHLLLTHAEVPEALSGRGVGSQLVRGVLERLRAEGATVSPRCSFVAAYMRRHPEYMAMLGERG